MTRGQSDTLMVTCHKLEMMVVHQGDLGTCTTITGEKMPAYIKNDVRKALDLELAICDLLGDPLENSDDLSLARQAAYATSSARVAALRTLLKHVPDDEHIDIEIY